MEPKRRPMQRHEAMWAATRVSRNLDFRKGIAVSGFSNRMSASAAMTRSARRRIQ